MSAIDIKQFTTGNGDAALIITSGRATDIETTILKRILGAKDAIILFVCVDRPPSFYRKLLVDNKLTQTRSLYLDVTNSGEAENAPDVTTTEHISNLTYFALDMFKLLERVRKNFPDKLMIVFFDALDSMQLYNDPTTLARFLHVNSTRFRRLGIQQFYIATPNNDIANIIKQFADTVIEAKTVDEFASALGADA